ncbi:hypothetical protein GCM10028833_04290 [Glycomyces tarimensis]
MGLGDTRPAHERCRHVETADVGGQILGHDNAIAIRWTDNRLLADLDGNQQVVEIGLCRGEVRMRFCKRRFDDRAGERLCPSTIDSTYEAQESAIDSSTPKSDSRTYCQPMMLTAAPYQSGGSLGRITAGIAGEVALL